MLEIKQYCTEKLRNFTYILLVPCKDPFVALHAAQRDNNSCHTLVRIDVTDSTVSPVLRLWHRFSTRFTSSVGKSSEVRPGDRYDHCLSELPLPAHSLGNCPLDLHEQSLPGSGASWDSFILFQFVVTRGVLTCSKRGERSWRRISVGRGLKKEIRYIGHFVLCTLLHYF